MIPRTCDEERHLPALDDFESVDQVHAPGVALLGLWQTVHLGRRGGANIVTRFMGLATEEQFSIDFFF